MENCEVYVNEAIRLTEYKDKNKPFSAGGRRFEGWRSLYSDSMVVNEAELYPCFDESDRAYEDRFYRWSFVCPSMEVFSDVKNLMLSHRIPLRQIFDASGLDSLASLYKELPVPMVFCEDGWEHLLVIERLQAYIPAPVDTKNIVLPDSIVELTELLAKNTHDIWAKQRIEDGWTYGPSRDDKAKKHPDLLPYDQLSENEKRYDRNTAIETLKVILSLGYKITR